MTNLKKIFYYSGTHWDREWYKPFQGFRYMLIETTDKIIDILENDPEFKCFIFDGQTIVLDDYSEIRPERTYVLRKLIGNGRIKVGPWYVMPDEFLCSGESIIRNLQIGHAIARNYNATEAMKYGYVCDIFGHIGQLPQILSGFGIKGALLGRGTNSSETPAHFIWRSYDGSYVITFKVPEEFGYATFWCDVWKSYLDGTDSNWSSLVDRACKYIDNECKRTELPYVVLMDSMDHSDIHPLAPKLAKDLAIIYSCPVVFESLENLAESIIKDSYSLPVQTGELNKTTERLVEHNMLIPHTLSSRYDIKRENDCSQTLMEKWAVPFQLFSSINSSLKIPERNIPEKYIDTAYKYLISCHAHDSICGCSVDAVHRDMHYRFRQTQTIAEEIIFRYITSQIDVNETIPFWYDSKPYDLIIKLDIWNPLFFNRNEELTADIYFDNDYPSTYFEQGSPEKINSFKILDVSGLEIPYSIRKISINKFVRIHGEDYNQAKDVYTVSFSSNLKAFGKTHFYIVPSPKPTRYLSKFTSSYNHASNDWFDLLINDNGTIDLYDKKNSKNYLNLISFLDDAEIGDGWFHVDPVNNSIISSNSAPTTIERLSNSPSSVVFRITKQIQIPASATNNNGDYSRSLEYKTLQIVSDITVSKSSGYFDVKTIVQNNCKDHRLRLVLPTGILTDEYYVDQAFAIVKRNIGIDLETSDWKECDKVERAFESMVFKKDKDCKGLLFISKSGLHECAATDDRNGSLLITFFRSFSKTFLTNGEPDGQLQGEIEFNYRIMPFGPDTSFADMIRLKDCFQAGIRFYSYSLSKSFANTRTKKSKSNPEANPIIKVTNDNLIISIIKTPSDISTKGIILRIYNVSKANSQGSVKCFLPLRKCYETDLNENPIRELQISNNEFMIEFAPCEIKTILGTM